MSRRSGDSPMSIVARRSSNGGPSSSEPVGAGGRGGVDRRSRWDQEEVPWPARGAQQLMERVLPSTCRRATDRDALGTPVANGGAVPRPRGRVAVRGKGPGPRPRSPRTRSGLAHETKPALPKDLLGRATGPGTASGAVDGPGAVRRRASRTGFMMVRPKPWRDQACAPTPPGPSPTGRTSWCANGGRRGG